MTFFLRGVIVLVLLTACTSVPVKTGQPEQINPVMGRSAIVTTGKLNLDRTKPSTLSWVDSVDVVGQSSVVSNADMQQQIQRIVESQIIYKGYPVVPSNGDFQLYATLVLANDKDKQILLHETGGIDPGLVGADQTAGKGSLVIELRQGRTLRWRGAVQIYILPEYDQVIATQRIVHAVSQLLQTWP